jgi:hypothetical protein
VGFWYVPQIDAWGDWRGGILVCTPDRCMRVGIPK